MDKRMDKIKDKSGKKQIKTRDILKLLMLTDNVGESSIRKKDLLGRKERVRKIIGSRRKQVASDTTIHRVVREMPIDEIRELIYEIGKERGVKKEMGVKLASGKKVTAGVIDGSCFGRMYASVFMALGEEINWFLDAEYQEKQGKEIPASLKMMKRLGKKLGKGFVRYIIGDGLYACQNFLNTCREIGSEGIVKTKEAGTLNIIKEAEEIIAIKPQDPETVRYVKGFDEARVCEYEIWDVYDLWMEGVKESLRVIKVRENEVKKNHIEEFYAITQAKDLSPEELRELAHLRWQIENNGFKALNEQCGSKRLLTKHLNDRFILLLIQLLSFNILQLYRKITTDKECEKTRFVLFPPFHVIRQALLMSLGAIEFGHSYG